MLEFYSFGTVLIISIAIFVLIVLLVRFLWRNRKKNNYIKKEPSSYSQEDILLSKPKLKTTQPKVQRETQSTLSNLNKSESKEPFQIFISYRRDDSSDITGRIYDRLVQHFGTDNIFKDVDSIPLGVDFKKHLDLAVSRCSIFLIVIGPNWLYGNKTHGKSLLNDSADFVRIELQSAFQREIPMVPLFVRQSTMPSKDDLPDNFQQLIYRNGINIRPDPDFHNDIDRLIRAIETHPQSKGNE